MATKPIATTVTAPTWLSRTVTLVAAIGIIVAVTVAIIFITRKLNTTEANLQALFALNQSVCQDADKMVTYCRLDQDLTSRRYVLAASGVSSALWTRYFTCLGGLIMVAVGSIFILMKLEITQSEVEAKGSGLGIGLKTSSPGLALTILGGILLGAAAYTPVKFEMSDGPSFLRPAKAPDPDFPNLIGNTTDAPPGPVAAPTPAPATGK